MQRIPYKFYIQIQLSGLSRAEMCPLGEGKQLHTLHLATADAGLSFSFKFLYLMFRSPCLLQTDLYHWASTAQVNKITYLRPNSAQLSIVTALYSALSLHYKLTEIKENKLKKTNFKVQLLCVLHAITCSTENVYTLNSTEKGIIDTKDKSLDLQSFIPPLKYLQKRQRKKMLLMKQII